MSLAAREYAAAVDLRAAWASRGAVVLALDFPARAAWPRLAGWVEHVSATASLAILETVDGEYVDVPCSVVLSVRKPHFHEPEDAGILGRRKDRRPTVLDAFPDQLAFEIVDQLEMT